MSNERARNIFISHVHEDDATLQKLKDLLTERGFEIRDASIDSSKPNKAKTILSPRFWAPRIRWAGAMIVLISPQDPFK